MPKKKQEETNNLVNKEAPASAQTFVNRLQKIVELSLEHIALTDAQGEVLYSNAAIEKILGYSVAEYQELDFMTTVHPDDLPRTISMWESVFGEVGASDSVEMRCRHKNGKFVWIEVSVLNLLADNTVEALIFTTRNIQQRKMQETQLRYQASLQDNMSDAVIVTDSKFIIQSWNKAAVRIYGWEEEEVIGKSVQEILQTQFVSPETAQEYVERFFAEGWTRGEFTQVHRDGALIYVLSSVTLIKDDEGSPFAVVAVNHNISERKAIEIALNEKLAEEVIFQNYLKELHEISLELTLIEDLDEFYKRVVELGLERFGFERMGLLLYDEATGNALGTYGTDVEGKLVDESHLQFDPFRLTGILGRALERESHFIFEENTDLYANFHKVGQGWNAVAVLWNGTESLGWLAVDNAVRYTPHNKPQLEILALYALSVGTLLGQKHARLALGDSEARYRLLSDNSSDMVTSLNLEAVYTYVSPSSKALLGYDPEEMLGYSRFEFIHPDDLERVRAITFNTLQEKVKTARLEARYRHKMGHYIWIEITGRTIFSGDGQVIGFVTSARDVSERKKAQASLAEYAQRVEDLYNNAPCGYHSLDAQGIFVNINETELQWIGYARDELLGKVRFGDIITPESRERFQENFPIFKAQGWISNLEFELIRKDGSRFFVILNATAIFNADGQFVMSRSTLFDITERKAAQKALEESLAREKELSELKSRFVATASHEFRTPLAIIQSSTDLLRLLHNKKDDDWVESKFRKIVEQVKHLTAIIDDVLNLGRLQSGAISLSLVETDMPTFCRSIFEEFENRPDINHPLEFLAEADCPKLKIDTKLMRQVLHNLLSNAIKYSPLENTVRFMLHREEEEIVLRVKDGGIGIPQEDMERLFEPFHRAGNTGAIPGTGLGLSIAKQYIEMHGGVLYAESEVGHGTTMVIRLPLKTG